MRKIYIFLIGLITYDSNSYSDHISSPASSETQDHITPYSRLYSVPPKLHVHPELVNVILFENRVLADVIKLREDHTGLDVA